MVWQLPRELRTPVRGGTDAVARGHWELARGLSAPCAATQKGWESDSGGSGQMGRPATTWQPTTFGSGGRIGGAPIDRALERRRTFSTTGSERV